MATDLEILEVLKAGEPGWGAVFRPRLKRLREVLSDELLHVVGLGRRETVPRDLSLTEFRDLIWSVRKDRQRPQCLREEAARVDAAFAMYGTGHFKATKSVIKLGLPCRHCWRTEDGRSATKRGVFGICHVHRVLPDPDPLPSHASKREREEHARQNHARNAARREIGYSRAVLRAAPSKLINPSGLPHYLKYGSRPTTPDEWQTWLRRKYSLVASVMAGRPGGEAEQDPLWTMQAIEGRALTDAEVDLYQYPITWEVPVAKLSAWLWLERLRARSKLPKREPEVWATQLREAQVSISATPSR